MHGNGWKRALFAREHIVGSCLHQQRQRKGHRESLPIGDGTGRDGAVLGWDGTGWVVTDIYIGYLIQGIRIRVSGDWGLDGHAGNVGSGTLWVELAILTFPVVPHLFPVFPVVPGWCVGVFCVGGSCGCL
jgi:hypothetical protein